MMTSRTPTTATSEPNPGPDQPAQDVVVIGGGLAGLIAANSCLAEGLSVRLIERGSPGGRSISTHKDGFCLNRGPHALYNAGELLQTMTGLGLEPSGPKVDGQFHAQSGSKIELLPTGPLSLLRTSLLKGMSKPSFASLMSKISKVDVTTLSNQTIRSWVNQTSSRNDIRQMLLALVRLATYNNAPESASADFAVMQLVRSLEGVRYLNNGWQQMVDALVAQAKEGGISIERSTVTAIEQDESLVTIKADGFQVRARTAIVAAGSPAVADRLLGTGDKLQTSAGPTTHLAALDIGLTQHPTHRFLLGIDKPLYFSVHSSATGLAPEGQYLATIGRYIGVDEDPTSAALEQELRDFALAAGVDKSAIGMERYLHRLPTVFGTPQAELGGLSGRPPVSDTNRSRVFLAGDWVGKQGFLADASAASAAAAAKHAVNTVKAESKKKPMVSQ